MNRPIRSPSIHTFFGRNVSAMRIVKSFCGEQHRYQCKLVLHDECRHVHALLDKKLGGGKSHRLHDHNEEFVVKNFRKPLDRTAGRLHLLGDFISDILPDVLGRTIRGIEKAGIKAPSYIRRGKKTPQWDISKSAQKKLVQSLSKNILVALDISNRIK